MFVSELIRQIELVSRFGDVLPIAICTLVGISLVLLAYGFIREALFVCLTPVSALVGTILQFVFHHPRPSFEHVVVRIPSNVYSFPSVHVMYYVVFWGFILYLCFKLQAVPKLARFVAALGSLYFILLIGVSRVLLHAHTVSDVVAGYVFGGIFLFGIVHLYTRGSK